MHPEERVYSCGCINQLYSPSGAYFNVKKCDFHVQWAATHPQGNSLDYFREIGALDPCGIPSFEHYYAELERGFSSLTNLNSDEQVMLEIGCGLGQYIPYFHSRGWYYTGLEPGELANRWATQSQYADISPLTFEDFEPKEQFDMIFGAHVFEHLNDAPAAFKKCYDLLKTDERGELWIIIPDDLDPTNPDHRWFFTPESLKKTLEIVGFKVVGINSQKIVPQENFLYCVAKKT